jgi:hypothetical protein
LRRQTSPRVIRFFRMEGEPFAETIARIQIADRRQLGTDELIAELREAGLVAIERRGRFARPFDALVRALPTGRWRIGLPVAPVRALRDLWLHRFEIILATDLPLTFERAHDGPIFAELVRASARAGDAAAGERAVEVIVAGEAGGRWLFGAGDAALATIELEPVRFVELIAGRRSPAAIRERARVEGDVKLAMRLLGAIHPDGR